jgi:hypothetical protein
MGGSGTGTITVVTTTTGNITTQRLLRAMMKAIGIVDIGNEPEPEQYIDALESVNMMLNTLAAGGLVIHHIITSSLTMTSGQSSYTIGTGGNFNIIRPNKIVGGFTRDSSLLDSPVRVIDRDQFNRIGSKSDSGKPTLLYYDPKYPLGTVYFNCKPDYAYTLSLDCLRPMAALTLADDPFSMPPEYEEFIKWNGAMRIASDYGVAPRADIVKLANDTMNNLTTQPVPMATFNGVPGVSGSAYNITSE